MLQDQTEQRKVLFIVFTAGYRYLQQSHNHSWWEHHGIDRSLWKISQGLFPWCRMEAHRHRLLSLPYCKKNNWITL